MKKILVAVALAAVASTASAAVAGSKHDLRANGYAGTFPSACMFCHTPHHATSSVAPLWARTDPTTLPAPTNIFGGGTVSARGVLTCLTCHATAAGPTGIGGVTQNLQNTNAVIGTNLATEHPVGSAAVFTGVAADGFIAAATFTGFSFAVNEVVECSTCHDVHNTNVQTSTKLLRAFSGGDFCGACHNK